MLTDWMFWISSLYADALWTLFVGLLIFDTPRYAASRVVMCMWDFGQDLWRWACGHTTAPTFEHCPSVCVILAGYNEGPTIEGTLESVYGSYPRLQIVVVDDGSQDDMAAAARRFAQTHPDVLVLTRPQRGGKSSAMNFALPYTKAEIVINIDADSELAPLAIWEMVQPFRNPEVGIVSATILARNPFVNLVTWLQAYEYAHSIFVGRMLAERLGILGIASGAFAATRREAIERVGGWDVGPPEDLDLTLRVRKCGYQVAFAPYAICLTDLPTSWTALFRQRLRWDQGAVVRNHCRKHVDMACFWHANFRFRDLLLLVDNWLFQLVFSYAFLGYFLWFCFDPPADGAWLLASLYCCALAFELVQAVTLLFYSNEPLHDAMLCAVLPIAPLYQLFLMTARLIANTQELLFRSSFHDNYVPRHVREATWRW